MSEDKPLEPIKLIRAVTVRTSCMLHGNKAITGKHEVIFNLGYGKLMIELGYDVECLPCSGNTDYLYLHVVTEEEVDLDPVQYAGALLRSSTPIQNREDEDTESSD